MMTQQYQQYLTRRGEKDREERETRKKYLARPRRVLRFQNVSTSTKETFLTSSDFVKCSGFFCLGACNFFTTNAEIVCGDPRVLCHSVSPCLLTLISASSNSLFSSKHLYSTLSVLQEGKVEEKGKSKHI